MGKKSLLSSTTKKNTDDVSSEEKEKKSASLKNPAKKTAPKSPKKKAVAKKKTPGGTTGGKKTGAKAAVKKAAKKRAPSSTKKKTSPKKKAVSRQVTTVRTTAKPKAKTAAKKKPAPSKPPVSTPEPAVLASDSADTGIDKPTYSPLTDNKAIPAKQQRDPMQKVATLGIVGLILLLGLIFSASLANMSRFYLKSSNGGVTVWQGRFSPKGSKLLVTLNDTAMPALQKDIYEKEEAYALIFENYMNQADNLLNTADLPSFDLIKDTLSQARPFAITAKHHDTLQRRLARIDMVTLVYKADMLAGRNTQADLATARDTLERALKLNIDDADKGLVRQKLQLIDQQEAQLSPMATME